MRKYFILDSFIKSKKEVIFEKDRFHHIFNVCKHQVKDIFLIITENKKSYEVEVTEVGTKKAIGKIVKEIKYTEKKPPYLNLALSVSKLSVMEEVIEKCVELGISKIQFFYSDYSYFKKQIPSEENKRQRWNKIIESAMGQSSSIYPVEILPIKNLNEVIGDLKSQKEYVFVAIEKEQKTSQLDIKEISKSSSKEFWAIIGSEGGFSEKEVDLFKKEEIPLFHLKGPILKVDTACVSILSILKFELGLWKINS